MTSEIEVKHTDNGIPVIVKPMPHSHLSGSSVVFGIGSRDERKDQAGISHMLEHMLFQGTKTRTRQEICEGFENLGMWHNGSTGFETTTYYFYGLDRTAGAAQDILADVVLNPRLEETSFSMEKKVVLREIQERQGTLGSLWGANFQKTMWGSHSLCRAIGGTTDDVKRLRSDDLASFFDSYYRPPKMAVVAAGNVDVGKVMDWASRAFGSLEPGKATKPREAPVPKARFKVFPHEFTEVYVAMGFPGLGASHPNRYALEVVDNLLWSGRSARLFRALREKASLIYGLSIRNEAYSDFGMISFNFSTLKKKHEKAIRLISREIKQIKEEGLEKGELERIKNVITGMIAQRADSPQDCLRDLGRAFMKLGRVYTNEEYMGGINAVTDESVIEVVEDIMDRDKLCIALNGPGGKCKASAKRLEDLDF